MSRLSGQTAVVTGAARACPVDSPDAAYVTGASLVVDGGWTAVKASA